MLDAILYAIASHTTDKSFNLHDPLRKFESCIQELEDDLESLQKHLIRNTVSLLNILNH